jgi:hypothetical protein
MWYRICWRSPVSGETQRGRPLFRSRQVAEEVSRMMNEMWTDTQHWVEPAEESSPPEGAAVDIRPHRVMIEVG